MKMVFGVLSLLIAVAIVGVLAKKQMGSVSGSSAAPVTSSGVTAPAGTPRQQVDQVKQSVEGLMQQARPMPEDEKK